MVSDRAQMGPTPTAIPTAAIIGLIGLLVYNHFGVDGVVTYGLLVALLFMISLARTVAPMRFF